MISLKGVSKSYKGITIFEDVNITFMGNPQLDRVD